MCLPRAPLVTVPLPLTRAAPPSGALFIPQCVERLQAPGSGSLFGERCRSIPAWQRMARSVSQAWTPIRSVCRLRSPWARVPDPSAVRRRLALPQFAAAHSVTRPNVLTAVRVERRKEMRNGPGTSTHVEAPRARQRPDFTAF